MRTMITRCDSRPKYLQPNKSGGRGELMLWSQTKRMCSLSSWEMHLQEVRCFMLNGRHTSLTIRITNVITLDKCLFSGLVNWASKRKAIAAVTLLQALAIRWSWWWQSALFPPEKGEEFPSSEAFHECVCVCICVCCICVCASVCVSVCWGAGRERKEGRGRGRLINLSFSRSGNYSCQEMREHRCCSGTRHALAHRELICLHLFLRSWQYFN